MSGIFKTGARGTGRSAAGGRCRLNDDGVAGAIRVENSSGCIPGVLCWEPGDQNFVAVRTYGKPA